MAFITAEHARILWEYQDAVNRFIDAIDAIINSSDFMQLPKASQAAQMAFKRVSEGDSNRVRADWMERIHS